MEWFSVFLITGSRQTEEIDFKKTPFLNFTLEHLSYISNVIEI